MRLALLLALLLPAPAALAGPPKPATPDEIRQWIAAAGEAKDHGNASHVVVLDESDVHVKESGLAETRHCHVAKVLTDAGVRRFAVLVEGFDPAANRVAFEAVQIHRKDGTVEDVDLTAVVTQPSRAGSIFWGHRQHVLDVPRMEIGEAIEIRTRRIGFNIAYLASDENDLSGAGLEPPMAGHWYEVVRFGAREPILRMRYSAHLPKTKPLQFAVYNGAVRSSLRFDGDTHVYGFEAEDIPPVPREPSMASWDDCVTKVVLATVEDWPAKSRWFFAVNETQFAADDAIRAKVAEITKGLETEEAKIRACLHWVADEVRYVGTSRGPAEGYTLHTGIETFRDLGGVCKDKAGMLVTMLRVLDVEAYAALTMAGPRVEDVPADQFNHTVCVVRNVDGTFRVLDPTWSPVSRELWSSREALQGLVYGTPEGQGLTLSPYYGPEKNAIRVKSEATIDQDGTLDATLRFDLTGYGCTYLRRSLDRHRPGDRRGAVESVLGIAPNAKLVSLQHTAPRDYSRDSQATLVVEADRYVAGGGDLRLMKLPLLTHPLGKWLFPDLLSVPPDKARRFAMRLRASRLVRYEETIRLPEGFVVAEKPKDAKVETLSATLTFSAKVEDGALSYVLELRVKDHLVPAGNVAGLRKALLAMKKIADERVVLRKGGAK